jgi:hypothetical protein
MAGDPRHLDRERLREIIDLVGRCEEPVQFDIFRRIGLAASFVVSRGRSAAATFEAYKHSLTPDRARAAAKRAKLIALGVGRVDSPIDEMAFMLVAASLSERAGAEWIDAEHGHLIDRMIRAGETLIGATREPLPDRAAIPAKVGSAAD